MQFKNVSGTGDRSCGCGSWKDHWIKFSGAHWGECQSGACRNAATVGAHVIIVGGDGTHKILPLCDAHNRSAEVQTVWQNAVLVSANVSQTCGKTLASTLLGRR